MSRADDLVPFLTGKADPDRVPQLRFRQGTVQSWNPDTGANIIIVGGAALTDVPMLNTGEAIALKAGHVVGLLTWGGSWFIVGRITVPGSPDFASASLAFGSAGDEATNFGVPTVATAIVSATIDVPDWADEALVHVTGSCSLANPRAVGDFATMQVGVNGGAGGGINQGFAPTGDPDAQNLQAIAASSRNLLSGVGGTTLTVQGLLNTTSGVAWAASASNYAVIHATAIFRSTV